MPDEANFVFVGESLRIASKLRNVNIVVIFKVRSVLVRTLLLINFLLIMLMSFSGYVVACRDLLLYK